MVIFRFVLFVRGVAGGGGYFMNTMSREAWIYGILLIGMLCYIIRFWAARLYLMDYLG